MHKGVQQWLGMLGARRDVEELLEFDVEDCFLNTPRELVLQALAHWLSFPFTRRRLQYFAISKDSKREDHVGRPCSPYYWELPVPVVVAVVKWELLHNAAFEVSDNDAMRQLRQTKGLPIGGHLSAALVELVALFREHTASPWPPALGDYLSCRYRDNFFIAVDSTTACPFNESASQLSELLQMPVKPVARVSRSAFDGPPSAKRPCLSNRPRPPRRVRRRGVVARSGQSQDADGIARFTLRPCR